MHFVFFVFEYLFAVASRVLSAKTFLPFYQNIMTFSQKPNPDEPEEITTKAQRPQRIPL